MAAAIESLLPGVGDDEDLVASTHDLLQGLAIGTAAGRARRFPPRPEVPLSTGALLVNGRDQPRIGRGQHEMASADRVDLLCAFIKWHGLRVLDEQIRR